LLNLFPYEDGEDGIRLMLAEPTEEAVAA